MRSRNLLHNNRVYYFDLWLRHLGWVPEPQHDTSIVCRHREPVTQRLSIVYRGKRNTEHVVVSGVSYTMAKRFLRERAIQSSRG